MKKIIAICAFLIGAHSMVNAQLCQVTITPMDTTICPGDSVFINATANILPGGQSFDFNNSSIPAGWNTAGGTSFTQPCDPSPDGTPYYWASTAGSGLPQISTAAFDVSCGGVIQFDMDFASQGGGAPCEGPDIIDEGVQLEYSTDGGLTWISIIYYNPNGSTQADYLSATGAGVGAGQVTAFTSWDSYIVTIPPGALGPNTMFRWVQYNSSGTCCDNWGIDNVIINASGPPCGATAVVNWDNGLMDTTSYWMVPTAADTNFVALVYDTLGNFMCASDTVNVSWFQSNISYDLVDTANILCPNDSTPALITNIANELGPLSYSWSNGDTTAQSFLLGAGVTPDTIVYYVDIVEQCDFTSSDSVVLIVNQTLWVDSLTMSPTTTCQPDGMVEAFVSGETGVPTYLWQDSTDYYDPGNGASWNQLDWSNVGSGWYYFTVTDNVCSDMDSIFVNMLNPPVADFAFSDAQICAGSEVLITNNSQNTTYFEWDFGNTNTASVGNMDAQLQTYDVTSTVTLTAYLDSTMSCGATTSQQINVVVCGCMDPAASNYDPNAQVDDGSCFYPAPEVNVPNIFTPNGDQANDVWFVQTKNTVSIEITILNRWGNLMYQETINLLNPLNAEKGWNGLTPNGTEAKGGTYFYKYTATGVSGDQVTDEGFLQLQR